MDSVSLLVLQEKPTSPLPRFTENETTARVRNEKETKNECFSFFVIVCFLVRFCFVLFCFLLLNLHLLGRLRKQSKAAIINEMHSINQRDWLADGRLYYVPITFGTTCHIVDVHTSSLKKKYIAFQNQDHYLELPFDTEICLISIFITTQLPKMNLFLIGSFFVAVIFLSSKYLPSCQRTVRSINPCVKKVFFFPWNMICWGCFFALRRMVCLKVFFWTE